jgi:hypothetical protein
MSQAARAGRKIRPDAAPDITLVPDAPNPAPTEKPVAQAQDDHAPPPVTLDDPWRYLHPSRVWPD